MGSGTGKGERQPEPKLQVGTEGEPYRNLELQRGNLEMLVLSCKLKAILEPTLALGTEIFMGSKEKGDHG